MTVSDKLQPKPSGKGNMSYLRLHCLLIKMNVCHGIPQNISECEKSKNRLFKLIRNMMGGKNLPYLFLLKPSLTIPSREIKNKQE